MNPSPVYRGKVDPSADSSMAGFNGLNAFRGTQAASMPENSKL